MASPDFGWELVLATTKQQLNHPNDTLVAFIHWRLALQGLRAVGNGEHFTGEDFIILVF